MKPISFIAGNKSRLLLLAAVATGVLGMQAGRGTMAYFTTNVTSSANTFTAGTLQFQGGDACHAASATPLTADLVIGLMRPGDAVYAPIEIDNVGSLDATYTINYSTATTGGGAQDLAAGLQLTILGNGAAGTGARSNTTANATACNALNFLDTTTIWTDSVSTPHLLVAAAPITPASVTLVHPMPLAHGPAVTRGSSDILCMKVTLPDNGPPSGLTADDNVFNNTAIGLTNTTIQFTFDGLVDAVTDPAQILNP